VRVVLIDRVVSVLDVPLLNVAILTADLEHAAALAIADAGLGPAILGLAI